MLPGRSRRDRAISAAVMRGSTSVATLSVIRSWKSKTSARAPRRTARPRDAPRCAVDQMRGDPEAVPGPLQAAFEHVADAEFAGDRADIDRSALVGEGRRVGDHGKRSEAGESRDDLRRHAVGDVVLVGIAAQVLKGEHRKRRRVAQRRRSRLRRDGAQQAVSRPWHGHDPRPPIGAIAERLTQRGDLDGEVAFLDERPGPRALHQRVLRDNLPVCFQQRLQAAQSPAARPPRPCRPAEAIRAQDRGRTDRKPDARIP